MIILTDCLAEKMDEGCIKVANSLVKKIKMYNPNTLVVSYGHKSRESDLHLKLNKLFINYSLISIIRRKKEPILYIPFASNTKASIIRTFFLSLYTKHGLQVLFALRYSMNIFTKKILKASRARVIALSEESFNFYNSQIGNVLYLKMGVDTHQFFPVNEERKQEIRKKYHVVDGEKVLLHVGHLKKDRNIDKLLNINEDYHIFLVVSSVTENEKDAGLRKKLNKRKNITIIESYLEHIEELYQMADVYLFPVQKKENCIDVPLSVLEAAACNIPIVTTEYGELKVFRGEDGFRFISKFDRESLNKAIDTMVSIKKCNNRDVVLSYDWETSIVRLMEGL